eukprot:420298-Amphidinium_carterae.1
MEPTRILQALKIRCDAVSIRRTVVHELHHPMKAERHGQPPSGESAVQAVRARRQASLRNKHRHFRPKLCNCLWQHLTQAARQDLSEGSRFHNNNAQVTTNECANDSHIF